jgi:predicted PurR-regulated permease PerM
MEFNADIAATLVIIFIVVCLLIVLVTSCVTIANTKRTLKEIKEKKIADLKSIEDNKATTTNNPPPGNALDICNTNTDMAINRYELAIKGYEDALKSKKTISEVVVAFFVLCFIATVGFVLWSAMRSKVNSIPIRSQNRDPGLDHNTSQVSFGNSKRSKRGGGFGDLLRMFSQ